MERGNQRDVKLPGSVVAVHYGGQHHLLFIRLRLVVLANQHRDSEIEMAVIGPDDKLVGLYREHREKSMWGVPSAISFARIWAED